MYSNIVFETVYYNTDNTKPDKTNHASICEIIRDLVNQGKYAIIIKDQNNKDIIKIDPFNNSCFAESKDLLSEYNKMCSKDGIWSDFEGKYCDEEGEFKSKFCENFSIDVE
jgi:hypothetical protein